MEKSIEFTILSLFRSAVGSEVSHFKFIIDQSMELTMRSWLRSPRSGGGGGGERGLGCSLGRSWNLQKYGNDKEESCGYFRILLHFVIYGK